MSFVQALGYEDNNGTIMQYHCAEPLHFDGVDFSGNPAFHLGPQDSSFPSDIGEISMEDMEITGAFDATGDNLVNVRVTMHADIRAMDFNGSPICTMLPFLGGACTACPSDGVEGCLEMDIRSSLAPYLSGLSATFDPNATAANYPSECN